MRQKLSHVDTYIGDKTKHMQSHAPHREARMEGKRWGEKGERNEKKEEKPTERERELRRKRRENEREKREGREGRERRGKKREVGENVYIYRFSRSVIV